MNKKKRIIITATAVVLLLAITAGLLIFLLRDRDGFDYTRSDISKNITLGAEAYKGYSLEVMTDRVTSSSVDAEIEKLLYLSRSSTPENYGGEVTAEPVTLGDKVYIYYTVCLEGEDGREVISSPSALLNASDYGVGSHCFLPIDNIDRSSEWSTVYAEGFDKALLGAVPAEHKLGEGETLTSGRVAEGDVIVFSYTDGGVKHSFMTSLSECDAIYGEGMRAFLSGADIGAATARLETSASGESLIYNNIRIEYAIRSEHSPLTCEIYFPMHYADPALRGRTATVKLYFRGSVVYNVPEYNEGFITETLGIGEDKLSAYAGEDAVARHRAMLLSECEAEAELIRERLVEEAVWDELVRRTAVTELPREALEDAYNNIYSGIYLVYANVYSTLFDTPEKFAAWYYGLESTASVASHVMRLAEREVTEKLIFYYIARAEGHLPEGEEFRTAYDAAVDEELAFYTEGSLKAELDALEGEAREKRLSELRLEMLDSYGEDYFTELVYYEAAFPTILDYAEVRVTHAD